MKFSFINYLILVTLSLSGLMACDAPDNVRFGNKEHYLSKDIYASVPVEFMQYQIALGDTIEEVQSKLGFHLEMNDYETYQQAEFELDVMNDLAKPKVACVFVRQRLVSFTAEYDFIQRVANINDTLQRLAKVQPAFLNLRKELGKNGISMYSVKNLNEHKTYNFKKDMNNNYMACTYQVAYPEFAKYSII
jgi:hypothetical protein